MKGLRASWLWLALAVVIAIAIATAVTCQRGGGRAGRSASPTPEVDGPLPAQPEVAASPTQPPRPLPVVSGDIFYRERIVLPSDARVTVRVVRLGPRGPSRPVIAEASVAPTRRLPIPFSLTCDPASLEPGADYGLEVTISRRGKTEFATPEPVPVLAGGLPTTGLKVLVRRTR